MTFLKKNFFLPFFTLITFLLFGCSDDSSSSGLMIGGLKVKILYIGNNKPLKDVNIYINDVLKEVKTNSNGEFSIEKVLTGNYTILASLDNYKDNFQYVEIRSGKTSEITIYLSDSKSTYQPPNKPGYLNFLIGQDRSSVTLKWACGDPNKDKLKYEIYLEDNAKVKTRIVADLDSATYTINNLIKNVNYYWKVVAIDPTGLKSSSDVYKFQITEVSTGDNKPILSLNFNNNFGLNTYLPIKLVNHGCTLTKDRYGIDNSALLCNGSTGIEIQDDGYLDLKNDFTISFRICPQKDYTSASNNIYNIIGKYGELGTKLSSYSIQIDKNGKYSGVTYSAYSNASCVSNSLIQKNVWTHVCMVRQNGQTTLYINGVRETSSFTPDVQISDYSLWIGCNNNAVYGVTAILDDVNIYEKALSSNEIKLLSL